MNQTLYYDLVVWLARYEVREDVEEWTKNIPYSVRSHSWVYYPWLVLNKSNLNYIYIYTYILANNKPIFMFLVSLESYDSMLSNDIKKMKIGSLFAELLVET